MRTFSRIGLVDSSYIRTVSRDIWSVWSTYALFDKKIQVVRSIYDFIRERSGRRFENATFRRKIHNFRIVPSTFSDCPKIGILGKLTNNFLCQVYPKIDNHNYLSQGLSQSQESTYKDLHHGCVADGWTSVMRGQTFAVSTKRLSLFRPRHLLMQTLTLAAITVDKEERALRIETVLQQAPAKQPTRRSNHREDL